MFFTILFIAATIIAVLCFATVYRMHKGTHVFDSKLTAEQTAQLPGQMINTGVFFSLIGLVSLLVLLPVGFFDSREQAEHRKQNALYQQCIDQAMTSSTKRTTAETAVAIQLYKSDSQHLIKYVNTRDAVAIVYCSELKPKSLNK